jgi:hypothetical protein
MFFCFKNVFLFRRQVTDSVQGAAVPPAVDAAGGRGQRREEGPGVVCGGR